MDKDLQRSLDLLKENEEQVRNDAESALLTICQNILSHPNDKQYRKVRLDDPMVITKLLPALGAIECLFDIGFVEADEHLSLPQETPLAKLQALQSSLSKNTFPKTSVTGNAALHNLIPVTSTVYERHFFTRIISFFETVLRYEDGSLQEKARKVIPIEELEIATMTRIRQLHKHIKMKQSCPDRATKSQYTDVDVDDARDLFLMELLHWFKYKFFTWVDKPKCTRCFSECRSLKTVPCDDPKCSQVEIYRCTKCAKRVKFHRYSDPEPLLTLRRGRCGEWANVFTLLCRSLGYDARYIHDHTDHVWTEVWSIHEKRWIHLDPCEDIMDRPLMYEKGWKKKLSYVLAFSKDEIQDVTWRYTRDQQAVMKRRDVCSETKLLQFIESWNKYHQSSPNYSASRRQYVIKRRLLELAELIYVPNKYNFDDDGNYQGRISGSNEWKLARGEICEANATTDYSWDISKYRDAFHLHYSIVNDAYTVTDNDDKVLMYLSGWQNGVNEAQGGMFRKNEYDWMVVYLARSPGSNSGKVKWHFVVSNSNLCVKTFDLRATVKVFQNANVSWEVEGFFDNANQNKSVVLTINDCSNYHTDQLKGSLKLILTASVSGGEGDCAWQHAQLFRQSLENKNDRSLSIDVQLENR
ncbi:Peptide-N(4)-(N-acetyl-beta-glucosaminyl)asparagine amidase [Habropoda laboriosa]|uniref:Peptide-N(4)-(N-acetyl-beta-glucosaminyl)asparagine amidase n=1 Tax=Habropoda laboriosa TaxID=597456 RepID=A0A0L7R362_9HYME|nr:PREDICTED: peptide-N(4)-(N-acetyl-beta-glucosaminyl)asparagine amidase [Habropoda laboriosa]KOC65312.1 Peptide-N(4)-(N-acetyl-beta-glucosaminyl)asparagine amidase [Habropoda laboriosa]